MEHDVIDVDIENKKLKVRNMETSEVFEDTFDKLVITSGSWPIIPKLEGIGLENILLSKNYNHSNVIIEKTPEAKNVVVVGAGYIGVELVEAFRQKGKNVTLIDSQDRILSKYLDEEYTSIAEAKLKDKGIKLALSENVVSFLGVDGKVDKVVTNKGEYEADLVILCIGFRPNTEIFKGKLDMLPNGAIIVDEYMRTSDKNVFAAGDCCSVLYNPTGKYEYIPLATNAVRMGTLVAKNLVEEKIKSMGTQGTSGIKIYDLNIAATGLTFNGAKAAGFKAKKIDLKDNNRPEFMEEFSEVQLSVIYDESSRVILGSEILSKIDMTQMMNTMSIAIQNKMTIEELGFVDFFFQPQYNKPWSMLNTAALNAL